MQKYWHRYTNNSKTFDMDAPNKIYLSKLVMAGIESLDKPVSDSDVEYIRKDALIEWLNDSIKEMDESRKESVAYSLQSMAGAIAISSFIEVKNKINSL